MELSSFPESFSPDFERSKGIQEDWRSEFIRKGEGSWWAFLMQIRTKIKRLFSPSDYWIFKGFIILCACGDMRIHSV